LSPPKVAIPLAVGGLLLNAFVWGVSWWPFRHLHAQGLHPLWATAMVYALALVAIVARWPRAPGQFLKAPILWVLLLASGTTNAAFNWAVSIGDVVRVVLLFYLMPLWAVLLARVLLRERLTRLALLRVGLALVGAAIVLAPSQAGTIDPNPLAWLGLPEALGLVGGFSFALNNVMLRREAARPAEARAFAMFCGGVVVSLALALLIGPARGVPWPPAVAAGWVLPAVGLAFAFLAANLALQVGAARLRASVTAVVMLTEIVFATVSAVLLGSQVLTAPMWIGGALILLAALLSALEPEPAH
jgi:drug/metabolite transporter (DMT)-like permease